MNALPIPLHVAFVTMGVAGGTSHVCTTLIWYLGWYWYCVFIYVLRVHAAGLLKGVRS